MSSSAARGPSAAARQARGPSAAARQARVPCTAARQAMGPSTADRPRPDLVLSWFKIGKKNLRR